jgi:hypothetical protein
LNNGLPNSWADHHGWTASWLLPLLVFALLVGRALVARAPAGRVAEATKRRVERGARAALAAMALVAAANYFDYGRFRYNSYLNEWDAYHYYVGTKYIRELGYTHLYEATLAADAETGLRYRNPQHRVRSLVTYDPVDADAVLADAARARARFTPERWREFVADIDWFKRQLPADRWSLILDDHGFNGTPPWSAVVGVMTSHLSIRDAASRWVILAMDPALLLAMLGCVAWAFGVDVALLMAILVGTHYLLSWGHLKGCVLRTDFAVAAVMAACFVKRGRFAAAGALLGWATISRVFPVLLCAGPAVLLASRALTERRVDRELARFFAAFTAVVAAAMAFAYVRLHGAPAMLDWAAKITRHVADGSHWNLGFTTLLDADVVDGLPVPFNPLRMLQEEPAVRQLRAVLLWSVRAAVLAPALYFMRYLRAHDALLAGFVLIFFLVSPDYYYFLIMCVPMLFLAQRARTLPGALSLGWMFLAGTAGYRLFAGWGPLARLHPAFRAHHQEFATTYYLAWAFAFTAVQVLLFAAAEAWRTSAPERALARGAAPSTAPHRRQPSPPVARRVNPRSTS